MGKKRASFQEGFTVAETIGSAARGKDSLLCLNNRVIAAANTSEIFEPIKRICAACATQRGILRPGSCKIRQGGSPDDFLNFATLYYIERWKKQFTPGDKRRKVPVIQNWIPYILGTICFQLIFYNKEVQDYDFLPMPERRSTDDSDCTYFEEKDTVDATADAHFSSMELCALKDPKVLHAIIKSLPSELRPYLVDILHYLVTEDELLTSEARNYVLLGKVYLRKGIETWIQE